MCLIITCLSIILLASKWMLLHGHVAWDFGFISSDKFSALAEGVWASHDKHKKKCSPAETEARGDFKKIHGII